MLQRVIDHMVLPPEVTDFERDYLDRMNRVAWWFFVAHVPVFTAVAYFNDTDPAQALVLTMLMLVGPMVAHKWFTSRRAVSIVYGFTAMAMGGLLVHFGQGPVQIEMHFYFFALLAMLAMFGNPMVILTAAVTVALHHLVLWMFLPASVFNYDAPIWVVLVHAAFVVLESVATSFIARSFFDNVIGLERIVRARTEELDVRNDDMRLVLDNVAQGFITIDRDGVMSPERSAVVEAWFGKAQIGETFAAYLGRSCPKEATSFELGWEQVVDGFLPFELTLEQLVSRVELDGRHLNIGYQPIGGADPESFEKLLVVVTDVTADVERARLRIKQAEVMRIFERIMRDKNGFLEFFEEANGLIEKVTSGSVRKLSTLKRIVHTLKGNAMLFGIDTIAAHCHAIEDAMLEAGHGVAFDTTSHGAVHALSERWAEVQGEMNMLLGSRLDRHIEVDDAEYEAILRALLGGEPREKLARRIADWRLEPTAQRLTRIGEQARRIATRLNKDDLQLEVVHNDLLLAPERWAPFWSAFVHVVRNAVDHGIEPSSERTQKGKPVDGRLRIVTRLDAAEFVVELIDDGRGIDWDRIAARATEMGYVVTDQTSLVEALFREGVSTATAVTEFSGRGVGMAAVRSACLSRGGRIHVHTEPDCGTRIEFRFPRGEMSADPVLLYAAA